MSPRPSEHPRPARRKQVAGPQRSSLPRLRHRAPDVTLPEFTQASGGHDRSLLRPPAPDPDTSSTRHAPLQTQLSQGPPEPRPRPQLAANRARRPPTRTASHTGQRRTSPAPGADFRRSQSMGRALARACVKQGTRLRRRFFQSSWVHAQREARPPPWVVLPTDAPARLRSSWTRAFLSSLFFSNWS